MEHVEIFLAMIGVPPAFASKPRNSSPVEISISKNNAQEAQRADAMETARASDRNMTSAVAFAPNHFNFTFGLSAARPASAGPGDTARADASSH